MIVRAWEVAEYQSYEGDEPYVDDFSLPTSNSWVYLEGDKLVIDAT